jgi:ribosomal protein S18 acetylase RimI-like enzyme
VPLRRFSAGPDDDAQFAAFTCWDGDLAKPWAHEAQNYIRAAVLRQPDTHVLKWCDGTNLVAVVSFGTRIIGLPLLDPVDHTVWHLDVMGVARDRQQQGHAPSALQETLHAMRAEDPARAIVTADVHRLNSPAIRTLRSVGITELIQKDADYWIFLGEL